MRHYWPDSLLGSTRLLRGRVIDARVGRDVLLGLAAGAVIMLVIWAREPIPVRARRTLSRLVGWKHGPCRAPAERWPSFLCASASSRCSPRCGASSPSSDSSACCSACGSSASSRRWRLTLLLARDLFVDQPGFEWVNLTSAFLVVEPDRRDRDPRGPAGRRGGALRDEPDFRDAVDARFERVVLPAVRAGARGLGAARGVWPVRDALRRSRRAAARGVMTSGSRGRVAAPAA